MTDEKCYWKFIAAGRPTFWHGRFDEFGPRNCLFVKQYGSKERNSLIVAMWMNLHTDDLLVKYPASKFFKISTLHSDISSQREAERRLFILTGFTSVLYQCAKFEADRREKLYDRNWASLGMYMLMACIRKNWVPDGEKLFDMGALASSGLKRALQKGAWLDRPWRADCSGASGSMERQLFWRISLFKVSEKLDFARRYLVRDMVSEARSHTGTCLWDTW